MADRSQLQKQMKSHLDSLGKEALGDLSDAQVGSLQLRLEVLEQWARLHDSATGDMYHDHDTNQHHDHEIVQDLFGEVEAARAIAANIQGK
ncbi:MAG TPA: hypothetical protein VMH37_13690 [Candidatus Binataceae bacterium]|nr:hypothetical protein [Candidatus Binataceae bacterium]